MTYDVAVLANWQTEVDLGFHEAPTDLAALAPSFGADHLFIDDCADADMECVIPRGNDVEEIETIFNSAHDGFCYSWGAWGCLPCKPWLDDRSLSLKYWTGWCNRNPECADRCIVQGF